MTNEFVCEASTPAISAWRLISGNTSRRLRFPREHEVIITDTVASFATCPRTW